MNYKTKIKVQPNVVLLTTGAILTCLIITLFIGTGIISKEVFPWTIVIMMLIGNTILYFSNQNSSIVALISCVLLILLAGTAYSVDHSNTDLEAYQRLYQHLAIGNVSGNSQLYLSDFGFRTLMKVCIKLGIEYNGFATLVFLCSTFLIFNTVKYITREYSFIIVCYSIMIFTYDVYQLRFLLGYSIIIFGMRYYLVEKKYNLGKYVVSVIIASLVHFSMIFYLIFIVKPVKKAIIKYYKIIIASALAIYLACYLFNFNIFRLLPLELFGRTSYGFTSGTRISIYTSLFITATVLFMIFVVNRMNINNRVINTLFLINVICIVVCPFLSVSLEFERLLRPIFLIDFAFLSNSDNLGNKTRKRLSCVLLFLCILRVSVMMNLVQNVIYNNYFVDYILGLL